MLCETRLFDGVDREIREARLDALLLTLRCISAAVVAAAVTAEIPERGQTRQVQENSEGGRVDAVGVGGYHSSEESAQPLTATLQESRPFATSTEAPRRQRRQVSVALSHLALECGELLVAPVRRLATGGA